MPDAGTSTLTQPSLSFAGYCVHTVQRHPVQQAADLKLPMAMKCCRWSHPGALHCAGCTKKGALHSLWAGAP